KDVIKKDDKGVIETKTQALAEASAKLAERMYAAKPEETKSTGQPGNGENKENVVDAEFEEVKDDKK
ncbi:MAG TPA: molecular chaperone DnaK, partial [Gammaproteobacteria bacterium]|nr:molecular chaperone DnaK [Gammaproteobacteria bacterium]